MDDKLNQFWKSTKKIVTLSGDGVPAKHALVFAILIGLLLFTLGAYFGQRRQLAAVERGEVYKYATSRPVDAVNNGRGLTFVVDDGDKEFEIFDQKDLPANV